MNIHLPCRTCVMWIPDSLEASTLPRSYGCADGRVLRSGCPAYVTARLRGRRATEITAALLESWGIPTIKDMAIDTHEDI